MKVKLLTVVTKTSRAAVERAREEHDLALSSLRHADRCFETAEGDRFKAERAEANARRLLIAHEVRLAVQEDRARGKVGK